MYTLSGESNIEGIHKVKYLLEYLLDDSLDLEVSGSDEMHLALAAVLLARLGSDGIELHEAHANLLRAPLSIALSKLLCGRVCVEPG